MNIISQSEMTEWQKNTIEFYCEDEMRELKKICNPLIYRKDLPTMYYDDLYSNAMNVLMESITNYKKDQSCKFKTFLIGNISRSFYDWTRDNERGCRCNVLRDKNGKILKDENGRNLVISNISIDAPNEDGLEWSEIIPSDFCIENELNDEIGFSSSSKVEKYMQRLSKEQRRVVTLLIDGYSKKEIIEILHIKERDYMDDMLGIKAYENVRILY